MISRVYKVILLCLLTTTAFAQHRLSGVVRSQTDSAFVVACTVYLNNEKRSSVTDAKGRFIFDDLPDGDYLLHFTSIEFDYLNLAVRISGRDQHFAIVMTPRTQTLAEVMITDAQSGFGFTRMRGVEQTGIYEGKKTEVILPEELTANLATNNARQIYSRVAGLNIWENDGAGLQLSIGGRGLDPSRTSNFNTRQNGYDISADALGYPESYYTPPIEAVGKIQIVRGAASLQYGTQFGGLINFEMKKPVQDKSVEVVARQTAGSYGFYNAFTSASGTAGKVSHYSFYQFKRGDGWRKNSEFDSHTLYSNVNYAFSDKTSVGLDVTHMRYLARQPGGLTDDMFSDDPRQSNRARNWFSVNWNLLALHLNHRIDATSQVNLRAFGLYANRYSVGFRPNRVSTIDDNSERDLIKGDFRNWGVEGRYLKRYPIGDVYAVMLAGMRYYVGNNHSTQGPGTTGANADFGFYGGDEFIIHDYRFPNRNGSFFLENIFYLDDRISVTPGLRIEHIRTTADGFYGTMYKDLAGNIVDFTRTNEHRDNDRTFLIAGLGIAYKPTPSTELYSNLSQNYRSITFSDMRIANPSSVIDPDLEDERGFSFDFGMRSDQAAKVNFDVSVFYLSYNNRIGEIQTYDENERVIRKRSNIGHAVIKGLEAYGEADLLSQGGQAGNPWKGVVFGNVALIHSRYTDSEAPGVEGNEVEFVPAINLKSGVRLGYKKVMVAFQYTQLSEQFTDATNASEGGVSAVTGIIPAYSVMDLSLSYHFRRWRIEGTVNNLTDRMYFTRRATGYPGPGILPSDGRSYFLTLQIKI